MTACVYPNGMAEAFIQKKALELRDTSSRRLDNIKSVEEWEKRGMLIREKLLDAIGGLPEKIPLNTILVERKVRDVYILENILLETLPGIMMNLNLYLPFKSATPAPAVIFATGHSSKVDAVHQYPVQGLVRKGYAVATFDCYGRGERSAGNEHYDAGVLSWLNGNNLLRYFIHDSICVMDYLQSREEIDGNRIGCTGTSGGGNTTLFHAALDERVRCAVPVCTVASFTDYISIDYPGCPEYYPQGLLGEGIDIQDMVCLIAPRPFLFVGGGHDIINSMNSLRQTCNHAGKVYDILEARDNISYFIDENAPHGYNRNMRSAMYDWMDRHMAPEWYGNYKEPLEEGVGLLETAKAIEFLNQAYGNLVGYESRLLMSNQNGWNSEKGLMELQKLLGIAGKESRYRIKGITTYRLDTFCIDRVLLETEYGIEVHCVFYYPVDDKECKGIIFVLTDEGKDRLLSPKNSYRDEVENGYIVIAADLRGMGENHIKKTIWSQWEFCSAERAVASGAFLIGYPLAGQRVYDILAILKYVRDKYNPGSEIRLYGEGHAAVTAKLLSLLIEEEAEIENTQVLPYKNLLEKHRRNMDTTSLSLLDVRNYIFEYSDLVPGIYRFCDF